MTERENLLKTLNFENPEWMPFAPDCIEMIMPSDIIKERPDVYDKVGYDGFGVGWKFMEDENPATNGFTCVPGTEVLFDITEWRDVVKFPDIESMDWEQAEQRAAALDRENKMSLLLWESGPWERVIALMGHEEAMVALMTEPEAFDELMAAITDYKIALLEKIKKHFNPDMICVLEDVAFHRSPFFSKEMYQEQIFPHDKRLADAIREQGIIYVYHSCGNITPLLGEIIKLGPKMILGGLAQSNDQVLMEELYGDQVCFIGPNNTDILHKDSSTIEEIVKDAHRLIDLFKPHKNLIFDLGAMYPDRAQAYEEAYRTYAKDIYK